MRKKYVNPVSVRVDLMVEGMIANSFEKSKGHADGDFVELTKGKNSKNSFWDNESTVW